MAKKRVHQIAKEKGISSKEVLAVLQGAGLDVKAAASSVDEADVARAFGNGAAAESPEAAPKKKAGKDAPAKKGEAPGSPEGDGAGEGSAHDTPTRGKRPARSR